MYLTSHMSVQQLCAAVAHLLRGEGGAIASSAPAAFEYRSATYPPGGWAALAASVAAILSKAASSGRTSKTSAVRLGATERTRCVHAGTMPFVSLARALPATIATSPTSSSMSTQRPCSCACSALVSLQMAVSRPGSSCAGQGAGSYLLQQSLRQLASPG